ncbi:MAG TPA: transcription-repair coupling factor [Limnochordia bacterium]|nr:transcription-repair coupling factor [Limnochordia bacterium]
MAISALLETFREAPDYKRLVEATAGSQPLITGLSGSQKSLYVAALADDPPGGRHFPAIVLTATQYQAERWHQDLATLLSDERVLLFPNPETHPHEEVLPDIKVQKERLAALLSLAAGEPVVVVAPVQAVATKLMPPEVFARYRLEIRVGQRLDLAQVVQSLQEMGYERVSKVETPGEFSVRGGILDVFPVTVEEPFRVDLFDDEVDSIRRFEPASQRSKEEVDFLLLGPAREFLFEKERVEEAVEAMTDAATRQAARLERQGNQEAAAALLDRVAAHVEKIREGIYFEGIEQYKPYFYPRLATLIDYVVKGSVVYDDPVRLKEHYSAWMKDVSESQALLLEKGRILPSQAKIYAEWAELAEGAPREKVFLSTLDKRVPGLQPDRVVHVQARSPEPFHGKMDRLASTARKWRQERFRVCLVLSTPERGERVVEAFRDEGLDAIYVPHLNGELKAGNVVVTTGALETGAEFPDSKLVVLTDHEVFGRAKRRRVSTRRAEAAARITDFSDLRVGDYVVHTNHGIGKYLGIETLEIGGVHKDYLVVQYAGEDKLYVPTDQVDLLQRYIGVDSHPPKLNKLGGGEWARVKKRVKESVHEMAEGLLRLYATRETIEGHAFAPDTVWQAQFEDAFPYEETPDQLRAIEEVKRDMERPRPMDRLLCGDVGYGKTEVAIRAAFKAVMDGKQVAVLVPTTILAQQHGRTFEERFEGYPVKIRVLSRFQSQAEQTEILKGLAAGTVDIVIGTHRLLSKDVVFKDLGLVIVDEEQRFGVAQKERLKELRHNVDVLTLTATPIPRTLHMSMIGVRDMSIIETPPEDRFPIRTYVVEYDEDLVREAIMRELGRQGQVYFVYNQVQTIDRMASRLMEIVPEARIAIAHGQMDEDELERVMLDFLHGEYDVLLCSTIIETGMDISNVNTLIVYDADRLGLAQLYQLRGRVGRSNRVAYAYFTYRRDKVLGEDAEKRLQAIKEFTELGSGFKIAMRDLEIRGAGNLLGPEQHGFIASVGFELYCRLLDESIRELKGEVMARPPDPVIDLNINAYISEQYIEDSQQKVEIYKKVAATGALEEVADLEEELVDRFGDPPESVRNLLAVARIKILARQAGVASISMQRDGVSIKLLTGLSLPREAVSLTRQYRGRVIVLPRNGLKIRTRGLSEPELVGIIEDVLKDLVKLMG